MIGLLFRRIGYAVVTLLVAVSLIFISMRTLPGNPLLAKFGQHPDAAVIAQQSEENGWNKPILVQLGHFYYQLATTGDLGNSIAQSHESVGKQLARRIPATMELAFAAMLLALPAGIGAGVAAAYWRNKAPDFIVMFFALLGVSIPVFFLGIFLRGELAFLPTDQRLPTFPVFHSITGFMLIDTLLRGDLFMFGQAILHLILPATVLATIPTAMIARITRSSMIEVLSADYVRTARAKGASTLRVVWRHAFPNAAVPVANIAGFQIGALLTGAVLTETVFDWPGLGKYLANAVVADKDYVVVQAGAIVIATMFVTLNLVVDLLYLWLDPRVRLR